MQNHIQELWTILDFLEPEKFGTAAEFAEKYGTLTSEKVEKLQQDLKPYMLRRLKQDVDTTIPLKEEKIIEVELTSVQKQYYRAILDKNREFLSRGMKKKSLAPALSNVMMELRKCCNHPFLITGAEERILESSGCVTVADEGEVRISSSSKLVLMDKLLKKLREGKHRVLIFSQVI